jgi:hypothetical protein
MRLASEFQVQLSWVKSIFLPKAVLTLELPIYLLSILKGVSEFNIPCEGSREEFHAHAKESLGSRLLRDCQLEGIKQKFKG